MPQNLRALNVPHETSKTAKQFIHWLKIYHFGSEGEYRKWLEGEDQYPVENLVGPSQRALDLTEEIAQLRNAEVEHSEYNRSLSTHTMASQERPANTHKEKCRGLRPNGSN